ncbi:MAG: SAM-dependent chlorinase/fluorinase, partial [Chloroflexi bacterium]|nr:SAM-dependent chlorinase/fluorinase [Chloroflexota bacterium]
MNPPLVVFTTDFGLSDPYAGVMKGVALTINPSLRLIDLTHQILPQNIAQGSF